MLSYHSGLTIIEFFVMKKNWCLVSEPKVSNPFLGELSPFYWEGKRHLTYFRFMINNLYYYIMLILIIDNFFFKILKFKWELKILKMIDRKRL